ncbi:MAG: ankyrin repeat domain-containing protein [Alphaproteobacteria bacterium]|jgi:ankyrin repeat protein|nr:ankyrin repeat domain-containing protein [Alphaproteobacteria bacterium]MDP6811658.1 ankyrin repeat domain-containing protein [Alphaproteobacteria bacterium]
MNEFAKTPRLTGLGLRSFQSGILVTTFMLVTVAAFAQSPREKIAARGVDYTTEEFIHRAAAGEFETVKLFLAAGMDVNARNSYATKRRRGFGGQTALHSAASGGHAKIVAYLLEKGAAYDTRANHNSSPLLGAALAGHAKVIALLVEKGADINRQDTYSQTPLVLSTKSGNIDAVKILLAHGAKVNVMDFTRATALDHAKNPEIVRLLKDAGGKKAGELR